MKQTRYHKPLALLGALGLSLAAANGQAVSHTSTTAMNNTGGSTGTAVFGISVKPGNAKWKQSAAVAGATSGPLGDGTLLDWQIHTLAVNNTPFTGATVSAGPGTYFDTATCADATAGSPQNYFDVWQANDIDTEASDIPNGTTPAVGNGPTPIKGNIDISGLTAGQIYVLNGTFNASVRVNLTMTGPGKSPIVMPEYVAPADVSTNRMFLMEFTFSNPNGEYTNIAWSSNNGQNNTGRRRWGGVFLDGTLYVDTVEPTWEATYPNAAPVSDTLFYINGQVNEASTIYYVVLPDGATAPSSAQVKAGTDASDTPVALSGDFAVAGFEAGSDLITGLTASTAYDVYVVAEDVRGPNLQATPVLVNVTTTPPDSTPPGWTASYPQVSRTPAGLTGIGNLDEAGQAHFVVLASGATAPTSAQVKAGNDASDSPAPSGSMTLLTAGVSGGAAVNGLTVGTTYDVYFVAEDLKGNLQASPQLVSSAPVAAVDQFVTGGFSWGTSSVWSATTLGPYTDPWGGGNNAVFEGTGGVVAIASGTIVNDMTFNSNTWTLQGGPLTLAGAAQPVINVNSPNIPRLENALAGTQGFRKTGNGILRMVGTNSITGGIVIDGGWIGDNLGPAGTLTLNNNDITANVGALGLIFGGGTVTNGGITLNDTTTPFSISNNNSSITINGAVTGNGGIALPKTGNGSNTLNLNSTSNTFTGVVNYTSDGIVTLNVNSFADATTLGTGDITFGLGNSGNAHNFAYGSGAAAALTLDKRQFTLAGAGATQTPTIKNNSSYAFTINTDLLSTTTGTRTLSLGGTGTGLSTFGGKITNGTIATLNLIKADSGTWVLGGDNDYNGTTTVSAGTLLINGDQSLATGAVAVNGGTLGGNGSIGGNVTVAAAGSVAPGASAGTLSIGGDLTIASLAAGKLVFELNTIAASDKIVLATGKVLTIGGGTLGLSDFSFTDLGGLENGTYTLIQTDQTISGSLAGDTNGTLGSATIDLQISGDGTDLELVVSGLAGGDPFATWAAAAGLDGTPGKENGKADDPDGDGKNNNYEFAFNGDPLDGSDNGLIAGLVQDASAPAGNELTLVVAVRDGATFTGSGTPVVQSNTTLVDGLTYTIQGTLDLATIPGSDVSHVGGPSNTAPAATGLPDLTGTAWEYHTFKLDASEGLGSKGFLRAKVE